MRYSNKRIAADRKIFSFVSVTLLTIFSLFCLLPFLFVVVGSFMTQEEILRYGYTLMPRQLSLEAYRTLFEAPKKLLQAYGVTILITALGTFFGLFFTSMAAFVLSHKNFRYRKPVSFFFYFTSIFGGGLVPWYIFMIRDLHLKNTLLSMLLPIMLNVTYLLIMKSYMSSIPQAIFESATIDGAGDFKVYRAIALPLSHTALATVGLFLALNYWNDWYNAMLFIDSGSEHLYPLQYFLHNILTKADFLKSAAAQAGIAAVAIPSEPLKLAMTIVATGPILLLYPFLQKYFVRGVTIGAVKD